jgi:hypothetical protein
VPVNAVTNWISVAPSGVNPNLLTWPWAPVARAEASMGEPAPRRRKAVSAMKRVHAAVVTATMGALALTFAAPASASFDRASYLRCMASDAMSVGGVPFDSSTLAKIGDAAYGTSTDTDSLDTFAKKYKLSPSLAALIVRCANGTNA